MKKNQMINLLNEDLCNERMHLNFYLQSAALVSGLHRAELKEFFEEQASSELKHILSFSDLIVGLGGVPETKSNDFPTDLTCPRAILQYALDMEDHVVENYAKRMDQAAELSGADGKWIEAFLENQIIDSRTDADHIRRMLATKKEHCSK